MPVTAPLDQDVRIRAGDVALEGHLAVPEDAVGVVLFAHGSGSSRHSSRNRAVAEALNDAGLATLLFDLLTADEERLDLVTAHLRFDVPMLARRVGEAARWLTEHEATAGLPVGVFGASTGGGAALIAAAEHPDLVRAVVSRGGRPDLAGDALPRVEAPTLLIVGERDVPVIGMNRDAMAQMTRAEVELVVVPGATHLFEEPGALERVAELATAWFRRHLGGETVVAATEAEEAEAEVYRTPAEIARLVAREAEPFDEIETADLGALLRRIGDARVVLLGEATHGTSEFYRMRQRITRALIEEEGFTVVAVEADWPDAERVDEYVRGWSDRPVREWEAFARFPDWMWRNEEVRGFVEWLKAHNDGIEDPHARVGFYGLDLYSLYTSIHEVTQYLEAKDPELARTARGRYACLMPFSSDPALYGRAVVTDRYRACEDEVVAMLRDLLRKRLAESAGAGRREAERLFDAQRNAAVVRGAEQYYRAMYYGSPSSWNLRDTHMFETLEAVLDFRGPDARAVVWAHNSHLGDAAATQMGQRGEINVGHLCREHFGRGAYLVGFGTHTGTVAAASDWGRPVEVKRVRPSHPESYEHLAHASEVPRFLLPLRAGSDDLRFELGHPRLERAIGVIYRPDTELQSHYFAAVLPRQFDEYVWFDETEAVRPLGRSVAPALPERHPFRLLAD